MNEDLHAFFVTQRLLDPQSLTRLVSPVAITISLYSVGFYDSISRPAKDMGFHLEVLSSPPQKS